MKYEDYYILHILNCFNGERSVSAVFHLLKGKKTSQTIQDGFLFKVHPFFQTGRHITRHELNNIIAELKKLDYIRSKEADHYSLTEKGSRALEEYHSIHTIPSGLNGWIYGSIAINFWKNISLLIQTLSHLHAGVPHFNPITRDEQTLRWVKDYLLTQQLNRKELFHRVRSELESVWNHLPAMEAEILSHRLSGYQFEGYTIAQLSDATDLSQLEVVLTLQSGLHRTVQMVSEDNQYTILKQLLNQDIMVGLTDSARKTFELLHLGHTLEDIARIRHLKLSTIYDHIVETAFCDPLFPIAPFVKEAAYQSIVNAIAKTNTRKLSAIKQHCPDDVDYFHIRLVLTREGVQ